MEFEEVFWNVMTTVGCIFSLFVVVAGMASIFVMWRDIAEDLVALKKGDAVFEQDGVLICGYCGHVIKKEEPSNV